MPSTVSIVVFPDPDGPTTATWSPVAISTLTPAERVDSAGVLLAHAVQTKRDTIRACHPSESVTCRPGVIWAPEIWT